MWQDKFGMEAQKEQIEEYCRKNDMNIIKWFTDAGESGAKERPGFDSIVYGDVSNPPYEAVVVAKRRSSCKRHQRLLLLQNASAQKRDFSY